MPPAALEAKAQTITTKRTELKALFDTNKNEKGDFTFTGDQLAEVKRRNDELNTLTKEFSTENEAYGIEEKNRLAIDEANAEPKGMRFSGGRVDTKGMGQDGARTELVSVGRQFVESKGFKARRNGDRETLATLDDLEVKTLFATSAGWSPFVERQPGAVFSPQQAPAIADVFPSTTTAQAAIKWMLETTYTNGAAMTAEGGDYGESALQLTEQTTPVNKVATFIPVTDEQLEDVQGARDYLDNRLGLMVKQKLDQQLITGDGTGSNLTGLGAWAGLNANAKAGGDDTPDTMLKAMNLVQTVGFGNPTAHLMNPTDWMNVRLMRTADGLYIWGHPSATTVATLWGLPVVTSTYVTLGTAYTGDFAMYAMIYFRKGMTILVSNSHSDWFVKGKQAIRADIRAALTVIRPSAFTKSTGL